MVRWQTVQRGLLVAAALIVGIIAGFAAGWGLKASKTVTMTVTSPVTVTVANTYSTTVTKVETVTATSTVIATTTHVETATVKLNVIVDALGRRVTIVSTPHRVVSLAPAVTEDLCALGLCGLLVGVDSYSKNIPGVPKNATDVGGFWTPSLEKIAALKPDLILACAGVPAQERMVGRVESLGLKMVFLRCDRSRSVEDIFWDLETIGTIFGREEAASKLVASLKERIEAVERAVGGEAKPSVALIIYMSPKGAWVAGGGTFQDNIVSLAGGSNVFSGRYGWGMVGFEELLAKNPDYVIVTVMSKGQVDSIRKMFESTPLSSLKAFREGRVCIFYGDASNALSRPSVHVVDAVQLLASILHPGKVKPPGSLAGSYTCIGAKG
jgi:iron complex transport system substrate-binding protein